MKIGCIGLRKLRLRVMLAMDLYWHDTTGFGLNNKLDKFISETDQDPSIV